MGGGIEVSHFCCGCKEYNFVFVCKPLHYWGLFSSMVSECQARGWEKQSSERKIHFPIINIKINSF